MQTIAMERLVQTIAPLLQAQSTNFVPGVRQPGNDLVIPKMGKALDAPQMQP